jgi:DNA invertase Pin-like site-specific DNA recombinase
MSKKPKAYSYIRFSTSAQKDGDSLRRQIESSREWCRFNNAELVDEMQDLGVSGFRGKHRMVGVLSEFLNHIKSGRIIKGSYLLVENLDRLSRERVLEALGLYTKIIKSGIVIVTLIDKQVHSRESIEANPTLLTLAVSSMIRGNEESEVKSKRLRDAWKIKRSVSTEEKMTARCPSWLKLSKDRKSFMEIPEKVKVVQSIFRKAVAGKGRNSIVKSLNGERVPCLGKGKCWYPSTIAKLLSSRSVIGEFTPHVGVGENRKPLEPIPNYYPTVIDPALFAKVQQIRKSRPKFNGAGRYNAFVGVAKDAKTHEPLSYSNKNRKKGWHYLIPSSCTTGNRGWISWQYDEFLSLFLAVCRQARSGVGNTTEEETLLTKVLAEQEEVNGNIERLLDIVQATKSNEKTINRLEKMESRLVSLSEEKENLEERIVSQSHTIDLPVDEKDPMRLRDAVGRNVRSLEVDLRDKSFVCHMHNGLFYEAKLRDGMAEIKTSDGSFSEQIK